MSWGEFRVFVKRESFFLGELENNWLGREGIGRVEKA